VGVVLYAAVSLDGHLAEPDDGLGFLDDVAEAGGGYEEFLVGVGALVMGRRTYDVIRALGSWPYDERPTVVVTSRPLDDPPPGVRAECGDDLPGLVAALSAATSGTIWLVGGGALARAFLAAGLVDELDLVLTPHVLGAGVPLWGPGTGRHRLELLTAEPVGAGAVRVRYQGRQ
jgi:dihydrofolate reductase